MHRIQIIDSHTGGEPTRLVVGGFPDLGNGSMAYVHELQGQIKDQYAANALEKSENDRLQSEVNDLKDGLSTVEEKARYELGMVKPNEIYIQVSKR